MKNIRSIVCLLVVCLCRMNAAGQSLRYYVGPDGNDTLSGTSPQQAFASLQKAQEVVRVRKKLQPADTIFVYLLAGEYAVKEPLYFGPEDGGSNGAPVIYCAMPQDKVVLNGGKRITGWKQHKGNIWVADLPQVKKEGWNFSQLYVHGESRKRASLPKSGFYRVKGFPDGGLEVGYHTPSKRFEYHPGDMKPAWKNLQNIEVVVYHFWTDTHLSIASVDDKNHIVSFQYPSGKVFTDDFNNVGARYRIENVWEGLQDPGDWYLDKNKGKLYYIPMPGEDMQTLSIWAPVAPGFIRMSGDAENRAWVSNIQFRDLIFQYANVQLPAGNTNNGQASVSVPAAITMKGAQHCVFDNCTIKNIGGYAFDIQAGSAFNQFSNNSIVNTGGGGFKINGAGPEGHPLLQTHDNLICDNEIGRYGDVYASAVGVLMMHARNNQVVHNHIHHGFYTGISAGWEWGYQRSISRDNLIAYNHIHHIGQGLLSDMGGVYTLGVSPGTIIRNNLIHDVDAHNYGGWGIYNDEGSSHILVENNIVYNTKFAGYNIHYAKEITVRNNIFALGRLQQLNRTRVEPHKSVYFENNIIYWKEGVLLDDAWQDKSYDFYFNPDPKDGVRNVTSTFDMDYNLYYNPLLPLDSIAFNKLSWQEWQKRGKDKHSRFTDPLFVDAAHFNFNLQPHSPAYQLGFQPIDMQSLGPRKEKSKRVEENFDRKTKMLRNSIGCTKLSYQR